jgi:hypothetical protein
MLRQRRVGKSRIRSLDQHVLMSVPEIDVRLIVLCAFLSLALDRGEPLLLLISLPGRLRCFAANQQPGKDRHADKLKMVHI